MFVDYEGLNYVDAEGATIRPLTRAERRALRPDRRLPNVERQNRSDARPADSSAARRARRIRRARRAARRAGWFA